MSRFFPPKETRSYQIAEVDKETRDAIHVVFADNPIGERWIPKSQIAKDSEVLSKGDSGELLITEWLAERIDEEEGQAADRPALPGSERSEARRQSAEIVQRHRWRLDRS